MASIFHELVVKAPVEKLYQVLTKSELLSLWWLTGKIEEKVGAVGKFLLSDETNHMSIQITALVPSQKVIWRCVKHKNMEWIGTEISFSIKRVSPTLSLLQFRHSKWKDENGVLGMVSFSWASIHLIRLQSLLEKGAAKIDFGLGMSMPIHPKKRTSAENFLKAVLGCTEMMRTESYTCFKFPSGQIIGISPDKDAPTEEEYENSTWLEIITSDFDTLKKRIKQFGVREVSGGMKGAFFFNLPGGAVFRLVSEEMSKSIYLSQW